MNPIYNQVIDEIINNSVDTVIKATKYISPKLIVRAVRKTYGKKIVKGNIEITLTIGKPNYAEREFIRLCQKAKEPFPLKNVQLKLYTPKGRNLSLKAKREKAKKEKL